MKLCSGPTLIIHAAELAAAEFVGELEPGFRLFGFTKGQFSIADVLDNVIRQIGGPGRFYAATWTIGRRDGEILAALKRDGLLEFVRIVTDRSFERMSEERRARCSWLIHEFGVDSFRVTHNHAKVAAYRFGLWAIALQTSGNMNLNIRTEQVSLEDNADVACAIIDYVDEVHRLRPGGFDFGEEGQTVFNSLTFGSESASLSVQGGRPGWDELNGW